MFVIFSKLYLVFIDFQCFFLFFQGLFRNFGDTFLDKLVNHLNRLVPDTQESYQRCASEIVAGNLQVLLMFFIIYLLLTYDKWRAPRKIRFTPVTTKARVVCYAVIQSLEWFSELTHSSLEASK